MSETPNLGPQPPEPPQTPRNPDPQAPFQQHPDPQGAFEQQHADPQAPYQHPDHPQPEQPPQPHQPPQPQRPERDPYVGQEWRRPDAASTQPGPPYPGPAGEQAQAPGGPPWPYAAPAYATPPPSDSRPRRTGRQLAAVAAITAVLGGLVGGGAVAVFDRGGTTTVATASVPRDSSPAPTSASQSGTVEAAAATATKSVVTLAVRGGSEGGTGSGVVIRSDGYILTNEHVVAAAGGTGTITVTFNDGRTASATVVGTDTATDLAVVKVNGVSGLTAATFADSSQVKVGQTVIAIGSPLGLDGTVTEGIVSALHRPTRGGSNDTAVIDAVQTDAPINPGNSGGPLVDLAGRVVGINSSIATSGSGGAVPGQSSSSGNIGIGFAIPANTAANIAGQLIASGKAVHAFLGVQAGGSSSSSTGTSTGATVASVESGGPAADAGLRAGDVVTKVDTRKIADSEELVAAVRSYQPGDKVTLTILRGGAERTVTVTLGSDAKQ